jgi:hypothetical protein
MALCKLLNCRKELSKGSLPFDLGSVGEVGEEPIRRRLNTSTNAESGTGTLSARSLGVIVSCLLKPSAPKVIC